MTWASTLLRKWITPDKSQEFCFETKLLQNCLVKIDAGDKLIGFSIFEPLDLNDSFFAKIIKRQSSLGPHKITLYVPSHLSVKTDRLIKENDLKNIEVVVTNFLYVNFEKSNLHIRPKMRVMNVDDSPVLLKFLLHSFQSAPWVEVIAQISNPKDAVDSILSLQPDLVTLDIQMPGMNGIEVLKSLFEKQYFPTIMISSLSSGEGSMVFDALNEGAFDYIQKPSLEEKAAFTEDLLQKAVLAVGGSSKTKATSFKSTRKMASLSHEKRSYDQNLVWLVGASTGGTQALTQIFTSLPHEIPPTLIVQHIPPVFSKSFANSLNNLVPFTVKEAEEGDRLQRNFVYIAPGGLQMHVEKSQGHYVIALRDSPPVNRFKPSVDYLFSRMAALDGLHFVAGILTGMGRDGAEGLLALKERGARTFAQDEASSAVYGMPRAAAELGAAEKIAALENIPTTILELSLSSKKAKA